MGLSKDTDNLLNSSTPLNKMAAVPIYDKKESLKNILLQNQESFEAAFWYIAFGTQCLPSLFR